MPVKSTGIYMLEKTQRDFLKRIPALRQQNYWEQLKTCCLLSIQRRQERYRIIYTWKVIEGRVPNCGVTVAPEEGRLGRRCLVPPMARGATARVRTIREQTFQVHGPRLFNYPPRLYQKH